MCYVFALFVLQESMETLLTPKKSIDVVLCLVCLVSLFERTKICLGALVTLQLRAALAAKNAGRVPLAQSFEATKSMLRNMAF